MSNCASPETTHPNVSNKDDSIDEANNKDDSKQIVIETRLEDAIKASDEIHKEAQSSPMIDYKQLLSKSKRELEGMVIKYAKSESENLVNKNKIEELDKKLKRSIKDNESLANRIRILTNDKNSLSDSLSAKIAQLTVLEQRNNSLSSVQTARLKELEIECSALEKTKEDLLKQIELYKSKEGELIDFSERLSMKQMLLQTELDRVLECSPDAKTQMEKVKCENMNLEQLLAESREKIQKLTEDLHSERVQCNQLKVELLDVETKYRQRIDELENEMKVMRRKHSIAAKEIYRQIKLVNGNANTQDKPHQTLKS